MPPRIRQRCRNSPRRAASGSRRGHRPRKPRSRGRRRAARSRVDGGAHGNVEEEPDPVVEAHPAQIGGERDEMVVVDPDHVVRPEELGEPPGEEPVDAEIAGGVAPIEAGEIQPVVAHRPEGPVGEAGSRNRRVAFREIRNGVLDVAEWRAPGSGLASLRQLRRTSRTTARRAASGRRVEGDRESAGIGRAGVRGHRHPVRDHDEAPSRPRNIRRRTHRLVMHRRYCDCHVPVRGLPALLLLPSSVMATPFTGFGCVLRGLRQRTTAAVWPKSTFFAASDIGAPSAGLTSFAFW